MVITHTHAKSQGQRSVDSKEWKQMDGRTDGGDCITSHANAVGNYIICLLLLLQRRKPAMSSFNFVSL